MNPLDELWNDAANRPDPVAGERVAAHFLARLRRRRRFQAWWLGWTFLALTGVTALAVAQFRTEGAGGFAAQWSAVALLALPWIVAVRFLHAFVREKPGRLDGALPLVETLAVARAANARERHRLIIVLGLLAVTAPVVALAIWQLHAVDKAAPHEAWSLAIVLGAGLLLGATIVVARLRLRLAPERRMLEALQHELDDTAVR
jgi:hypothetical protein